MPLCPVISICKPLNIKDYYSCTETPTLRTYLIGAHRHAPHNHWVHSHLSTHLSHMAPSSIGLHGPVHHHSSVLPWISLLPKLLLTQWCLWPKLLLRVRTGDKKSEMQTGFNFKIKIRKTDTEVKISDGVLPVACNASLRPAFYISTRVNRPPL